MNHQPSSSPSSSSSSSSSPPPSPPSLWDSKPWWCQPWTIILTGLTIPTGVWILSHRLWLVVPVSILVLGWWILFLYLVPKAYAEAGGEASNT